jgi:predicted O-methyltransferase YrrM
MSRLRLTAALIVVLAAGAALGAQSAAQPPAAPIAVDDATLWQEFQQWVEGLAHLPPGQRAGMGPLYTKSLMSRGVTQAEATARLERINVSRRGSPERERIYWNAVFKLGGGPDEPLRLLQETVRDLKPGRALDPAMGRGRNSIYLASLGWEVTGYDPAPDALTAAQSYAKQAGVSVKTVQATHDTFDLGAEQWDLIVISYAYIPPLDPAWPPRIWKALRPGGLVVLQTSYATPAPASHADVATNWRQFRILRLEHPETPSDDWLPNVPYVRLVLRKPR